MNCLRDTNFGVADWRRLAVCLTLLITVVPAFGEEELPYREAVVQAPVLEDIKIDGKLDDWPAAMPRHAIFNLLPRGEKSWEGTDFTTSEDLSCVFLVGYSPEQQLLYVGVVVRDDKLIIGNTSDHDTDGMELYVDGLRSERGYQLPGGLDYPWFERVELADLPVQTYVAIPGPGPIYGSSKQTNPIVLGGDLEQTKTRMAFTRIGDVTTYEWAVQVFDQYPDQPTKLEPGKRIGFDIVIVDKDVPAKVPRGQDEAPADMRAWIYWGANYRGTKTFIAGNLGEVVLGE